VTIEQQHSLTSKRSAFLNQPENLVSTLRFRLLSKDFFTSILKIRDHNVSVQHFTVKLPLLQLCNLHQKMIENTFG